MPKEVYERMLEEAEELEEKIDKLHHYINAVCRNKAESGLYIKLLWSQLYSMETYLHILQLRIGIHWKENGGDQE